MKRGALICFTGIDGTGKTTLSKELVGSLKKKGVECKYVYGRLNSFILRPFTLIGGRIFLHGRDVSKDYSGYVDTKKKALVKHSFLSGIYQQILLFDYVLQVFFKVKLPLMFGKNIVCDRYVYDTVITDLFVDMNYSRDRSIRLINNLLRLFPEPDIAFLIDVSEKIAYERKNDTLSLRYLEERRGMYLDAGREYNMVILDGFRDLTELKEQMRSEVFRHMEGGDVK